MSNGTEIMARGPVAAAFNDHSQAVDTKGRDAMSRALAAQATASVQARYVMAMQRPRVWLEVRRVLNKLCRDPSFAAEAWFSKPAGREKVEGLTIRFAEEAARTMTNLDVQVFAIYDDEDMRITRVSVVDLESNLNESREISIRKVVERRSDKGREVVGQRLNSYGDTVYIVKATDDEISNVENTQISKAKRNAILAMLRADIKAECIRQIKNTHKSGEASPIQWIKDMADRFDQLGVSASDLEEWLGHSVEQISQGEVSQLRGVFGAVMSGEMDWSEELERQRAGREARNARAREQGQAQAPAPSLKATKKQADPAPTEKTEAPADAAPTPTKADVLRHAQGLKVSPRNRDAVIREHFGKDLGDIGEQNYAEAMGIITDYAQNEKAD